jgi:peptidoglycan/LPS O-acetylase OafA/YrhL
MGRGFAKVQLCSRLISMNRIGGLDTIRFVCAFWVVLSHLEPPDFFLKYSGVIPRLISAVLRNAFVGVCAVIAFFVISGFCIHYPRCNTLRIRNTGSYFLKRYFRLGIPLLVALILGYFLNVDLHNTILWSLYCELIYYTIYPVLLGLRRSCRSWYGIISVSFVACFTVAALNYDSGNFHGPGIALTWLLGLPSWLLGCALAESVSSSDRSSAGSVWTSRWGIWLLSVVCSVMRFHTPLGYVWTLPLFGLAVTFWIHQEILNAEVKSPIPALERAGSWSYSLYLVHMLISAIYLRWSEDSGSTAWTWVIHIGVVMLISYVFAIVVEYPAHRLAVIIGNRHGRE